MEHQSESWKSSETIVRQIFLGLLPAQILSVATASLSSLINGYIIGNWLPAIAMVVLGFVGPLTSFFGAVATVFAGGARVLCGRYIGRNDRGSINALFTAVVTVTVFAGIILSVVLYCRPYKIATLLVPALMVFLQMVGYANYALLSAVVLAGCNIVFSLLSVHVFHGGVYGIGCAVSLSQWVAMFFLFARFRQNDAGVVYKIKTLRVKNVLNVVVLGSPAALATMLYSLRNIFINTTAMSFGGVEAVAAVGVSNSVMGLFDAVNVGVGAAALIMASIYVGEKNADAMKRLMRCVVKYGGLLALIKLLILAIGGDWIGRMFGATGKALHESYRLMVFQGINMPFNILLMAIVSPYQALGRVKFVNIMYIFSAFGISVSLLRAVSSWALTSAPPACGCAILWRRSRPCSVSACSAGSKPAASPAASTIGSGSMMTLKRVRAGCSPSGI